MRHGTVTLTYFKWNILPIKVAAMLRLQAIRHKHVSGWMMILFGLCMCLCVYAQPECTET